MHTDQLVYFLILLSKKKYNGKNIYDIGSTNEFYLSELFSKICSILKKKNLVSVSNNDPSYDIYKPLYNIKYLEKNMPYINFSSAIKKYYNFLLDNKNC